MEYLAVSDESLRHAAVVLQNGGLVAFPTETVYGLGADAYNSEALAKIFKVKERPRFDPLIIHIAAVDTLEKTANLSLLSKEKKNLLFLLAENLWPGPLSFVLPKNDKIPGIATAGLPAAAIRFPDNETAQKLIALAGGAIAAPSANPFGGLSPTRAQHVLDTLGEKVDVILDGGPARIGLESTVLDLSGKSIKILRPGGTPKEAIEKLTGCIEDDFFVKNTEALLSPGQLKNHYAPKAPLTVFNKENIYRLPYNKNCAYLFFDCSSRDEWQKHITKEIIKGHIQNPYIRLLSPSGKITEAAARLFETLHEFDSLNIPHIYAQLVPHEGLGAAINDRLIRGQKTPNN